MLSLPDAHAHTPQLEFPEGGYPLLEYSGNDGHPDGGSQSGETRRGHPGQPGGGAELPASLEGPQRLRPAERHRAAVLPAAGLCFPDSYWFYWCDLQ